MIIRKSNIGHPARRMEIPTFRALAWMEHLGNRRLAFVTLSRDQENVDLILYRDVMIDGSSYFCINVRDFVPRPCRPGDTVGIVVTDVQSVAAGSDRQVGARGQL